MREEICKMNSDQQKGPIIMNHLLLMFFVYVGLSVTPNLAQAYFTNADSGELVPKDQYRLILEPQMGHFNITAHFDAGVTDSSQLRVSLGAGEDGTHFDFFYKSIPYPDFENQPAIGYKVGTIFASDKGSNVLSIRFMPLISKTYVINQNRWTPYLSIPLSVSMYKSTSTTPLHAVFGTELTLANSPDMQIGFEGGSTIKDGFSYASVFISFYFEPSEMESDGE
jgi:hypothetical protein